MAINDKFKEKLLTKNPFEKVLGQEQQKKQLISALLMDRHVLILGNPGIGKTTLAKNVADLLPDIKENGQTMRGKDRFIRVQGSPDLTVEDILGDIDPIKALEFGPLSKEAFTPGKIFKADKGILFFDELNRCPEKLQNALLQVLQEGYATIGGYDVDFSTDFIFIATMNPEDSSTEKISDVLLDRFDVIYMDYPETQTIEEKIVSTYGSKHDDVELQDKILTYIIKFIRLLRKDSRIDKKPSVRASLGLYERSQSNALLAGRKKVNLLDVREAMLSVLAHRISLKPSIKYNMSPTELLKQEFDSFLNTQNEKLEEGDSP
ncbi:MoxR family ATPase [Candidatus Woesearchaeota archaeon]|nr:MoxR family ATPase [Candidatus Woesearchaeota archaeon]